MPIKRWVFVALVNLVLFVALLGIAEVAARVAFPCTMADRLSPWSFVPKVGDVHQPNALVRDTNGFDFCVEQRANTLGFLDAEPPAWNQIKDKLRVALVGDSFVEATQVPPAQKVQHLLAQDLAAAGIDANVVGWGISSLGQVQELPMFEHFGLPLHPHVVVLVIVYNDLKNNSWLLQAVEEARSPQTPEYTEIRPSEHGGWTEIAPVPVREIAPIPVPAQSNPARWAQLLMSHSRLYGYAVHRASWEAPRLHAFLTGQPAANRFPDVIRELSRDPALAPLLANWPPTEGNIDSIFERRPWPRAFDLAVAATEHSMDQWAALAHRENFKLIALMSGEFKQMPEKADIWRRILAERSIPAIWYGDAHPDPSAWHFLRDGHWNPQGHRWAASLIADFLITHRSEYLPGAGQNLSLTGR